MIERRNSRPAALRRWMDLRRDVEADVRPRRVVSRNADGTAQVVALDGECPENGGLEAQTGVIYTPGDFRGATLGTLPGTAQTVAASGVMRIDSYEPRALARGRSHTVRLTGQGFVPSMVVDHVVGGETLYPGITAQGLNVLDSGRADLDLEITADAPLGPGGLAYQDSPPPPAPEGTTAASLRLSPAYEVVASTDYRWVAWFLDGSRLVAVEVHASGGYGAEAGRVSSTGFTVGRSSPIPRDSTEILGNDSAVWVDDRRLYLADFRAGTVHTLEAESGRRMAGACYLPDQGRLAWIEWTPGDAERSTVVFWTANPDLTEPEQRTAEARHRVGGGVGPVDWTHNREVGFAPNAMGVDLEYVGPNELPANTWLYQPNHGPAQSFVGFGTDVGVGMPHASGSIAGADRWDGTSGGEGFTGFVSYLNFEAPERGAVAGDGAVTLFDPGSLHLVEVSPPFNRPDVDITLNPHPVLGSPVRVVPGR